MIGRKLGEGREAEVFAWGADAVLKLYRDGFGGHQTESAALQALDGQGIAPKLIGVIERDGRAGIVMQRLGGSDMLTLLERKPWQVLGFGRILALTHAAVHRTAAPAGLPDLRHALAGRIRDAGLPAPLERFAMHTLERLAAGDRLCHGDYHPGNVLLSPDGAQVIDWAAATGGPAEADHARTLMLLRWANPLPGTPVLFRGLIAGGRRLLAGAYASAYRKAAPQPLLHLDSWLAVNVAARLSEGIDAERPKLLSLLTNAASR
jgi:Ser/Thr protein kinase RdoA (MazF antagonist)